LKEELPSRTGALRETESIFGAVFDAVEDVARYWATRLNGRRLAHNVCRADIV